MDTFTHEVTRYVKIRVRHIHQPSRLGVRDIATHPCYWSHSRPSHWDSVGTPLLLHTAILQYIKMQEEREIEQDAFITNVRFI